MCKPLPQVRRQKQQLILNPAHLRKTWRTRQPKKMNPMVLRLMAKTTLTGCSSMDLRPATRSCWIQAPKDSDVDVLQISPHIGGLHLRPGLPHRHRGQGAFGNSDSNSSCSRTSPRPHLSAVPRQTNESCAIGFKRVFFL